MNTKRKMLVWNAVILAAAIIAAIVCLKFDAKRPLYKHWVVYWIVVTNFAIVVCNVVLGRGLQKRQNAAKADGLILCSKCEYPLDLSEGKAKCPECGSLEG